MHRRVRLVLRVRVRARVRLLAPARLRLQHCTTRDELQCTKMSCNAMFNVIRMASSIAGAEWSRIELEARQWFVKLAMGRDVLDARGRHGNAHG